MSGLVYSYTRFSDPRQASGHSVQRQTDFAEKWAKDNGLRLDSELTMRDEGLSAFHQKHVTKGALGTFLAAVEAGKVPPGSVLIVEALDRLSRANPMDAQAQLTSIVNAGLTVVTASDKQVYSRESLKKDSIKLVISVLYMIKAHEESAHKSERVASAIVGKCKDWELGKFRGKLRQGKDPQWLRETPDGWEFIPGRVEALRRAVALYLAGQSGQDIAAKLAAEGISPFNGLLSSAHFYKVVKNPNLIGVKTVVVETEDVRGEFALKEYYPAVLSATEWDDLQAVNGQRGRRGAKSTIPHIITGLGITYCGYCGCAMSGQHLFGKIKNHGDKLKDGYRRLLCAAKQYGKACPHPVSRSVAPVERAIMNYCSDILNLRALYGGDRSAPLRVQLKAQRQRAGEIAEQSGNLMNAILSASSGVAPSMLVEKMSELETEKRTLERAMAHTEAQISALARNDVNGVQAKWAELAKGVQELDYDARLQAKQLVADTFERIVVYSTGVRPDDENRFTDVVLLAKGGASRMLRVDKSGAWQALEDVHRDAQDAVAA